MIQRRPAVARGVSKWKWVRLTAQAVMTVEKVVGREKRQTAAGVNEQLVVSLNKPITIIER
jgi:hypothetical protein